MGKFYEQSPLSAKLSKEFDKVPERGLELADKVDKIVLEIQNSKNDKLIYMHIVLVVTKINPEPNDRGEQIASQFYSLAKKILKKA